MPDSSASIDGVPIKRLAEHFLVHTKVIEEAIKGGAKTYMHIHMHIAKDDLDIKENPQLEKLVVFICSKGILSRSKVFEIVGGFEGNRRKFEDWYKSAYKKHFKLS